MQYLYLGDLHHFALVATIVGGRVLFFFFFGWVDGWGWMGFYSELIFNENPPFAISGFRWRFFLADLTASMPKDSDFTFFHDAFEAEHFANCM